MRERSSSGGMSSDIDEDLIRKDKKKLKTCGSSSCEEFFSPMQDDFDFMWDKLVIQLRRILQLKTVEAVRIAEDGYNLSIKGCNRPRLVEETEKLILQHCGHLSQYLSILRGETLLREYYKNWEAYLLSIEDINIISKVLRIQGIVKRALTCWTTTILYPLQQILQLALYEKHYFTKDTLFMDISSVTEPVSDSPDSRMNIEGNSTETMELWQEDSIFVPYYKDFNQLFKMGSTLKKLFPYEDLQLDDEDDFLYEDILKMKLPNINIPSCKEEGMNFGIANTSLLPAELVFEIFTFLSSEKDLKIAGQVCRRWYVLTKQRSLWHALKARKAVCKDWVRMYSREGHEFMLGLTEANRSGTIGAVLKMHTAMEAKTHTIRFGTIRTHILEKIVQYFYYKMMYTNSNSVIPDFPIEPEIALEILMASNLLDC